MVCRWKLFFSAVLCLFHNLHNSIRHVSQNIAQYRRIDRNLVDLNTRQINRKITQWKMNWFQSFLQAQKKIFSLTYISNHKGLRWDSLDTADNFLHLNYQDNRQFHRIWMKRHNQIISICSSFSVIEPFRIFSSCTLIRFCTKNTLILLTFINITITFVRIIDAIWNSI